MSVAQHRHAVRTCLVEQQLHPVRQQRRRDRNQHPLVAGASQRLAPAARGKQSGRRQNEKDLLIRAPGQGASELLWGRPRVAGYRMRDGDVRLGRPDCDWEP